MITKQAIETMKAEPFTEMIGDLARRGGETVTDHFLAFLAVTGPYARDIDKRWHALAFLAYLYTKYAKMAPEIEAIKTLLIERLRNS